MEELNNGLLIVLLLFGSGICFMVDRIFKYGFYFNLVWLIF